MRVGTVACVNRVELMPRGPKGEKRTAEVIGAAVMVGSITTSELDQTETLPTCWDV